MKRALIAFDKAVKFADELDFGPSASNGSSNGHSKLEVHTVTTQNGAPPQARHSRPPIPLKSSISQYRQWELAELIKWISSDGKLRTDDEIVSEMVSVLGFARRGTRIDSAIRSAIPLAQSK